MNIEIARTIDNLNQDYYGVLDPAPSRVEEFDKELDLFVPDESQYILRMIISIDCGQTLYIPKEFMWVESLIDVALLHQSRIESGHPFVYLTIRHGQVQSKTDDSWHVDGFSLKIPHRPEQNYIWCDNNPTEWWDEKVCLPLDFDGHKHNINLFFEDHIGDKTYYIEQCQPKTVYCLDPYVVHRRPPNTCFTKRTFVRVSFIPIPILDVNNTKNPAFPFMDSSRDGVAFRNTLLRYKNP